MVNGMAIELIVSNPPKMKSRFCSEGHNKKEKISNPRVATQPNENHRRLPNDFWNISIIGAWRWIGYR